MAMDPAYAIAVAILIAGTKIAAALKSTSLADTSPVENFCEHPRQGKESIQTQPAERLLEHPIDGDVKSRSSKMQSQGRAGVWKI